MHRLDFNIISMWFLSLDFRDRNQISFHSLFFSIQIENVCVCVDDVSRRCECRYRHRWGEYWSKPSTGDNMQHEWDLHLSFSNRVIDSPSKMKTNRRPLFIWFTSFPSEAVKSYLPLFYVSLFSLFLFFFFFWFSMERNCLVRSAIQSSRSHILTRSITGHKNA